MNASSPKKSPRPNIARWCPVLPSRGIHDAHRALADEVQLVAGISVGENFLAGLEGPYLGPRLQRRQRVFLVLPEHLHVAEVQRHLLRALQVASLGQLARFTPPRIRSLTGHAFGSAPPATVQLAQVITAKSLGHDPHFCLLYDCGVCRALGVIDAHRGLA